MEHNRLSEIKKPPLLPSLFFKVNASLAVRMGWLSPDQSQLGNNLYYSLPYDKICQAFIPAQETEMGGKDFWHLEGGFLRLSLTVDWHFVMVDELPKRCANTPPLNAAFEARGAPQNFSKPSRKGTMFS